MSYGLIPLGRKPDKELLDRYQYLQKFLKESKEFGAQRQESEKESGKHRPAKPGTQLRLRRRYPSDLEHGTELIKELLPYLSPKEIDGVEVYVSNQ